MSKHRWYRVIAQDPDTGRMRHIGAQANTRDEARRLVAEGYPKLRLTRSVSFEGYFDEDGPLGWRKETS